MDVSLDYDKEFDVYIHGVPKDKIAKMAGLLEETLDNAAGTKLSFRIGEVTIVLFA